MEEGMLKHVSYTVGQLHFHVKHINTLQQRSKQANTGVQQSYLNGLTYAKEKQGEHYNYYTRMCKHHRFSGCFGAPVA